MFKIVNNAIFPFPVVKKKVYNMHFPRWKKSKFILSTFSTLIGNSFTSLLIVFYSKIFKGGLGYLMKNSNSKLKSRTQDTIQKIGGKMMRNSLT